MEGLGLAPPAELCLDGNLAENWRKWRRNFENFLTAINLVARPLDGNGDWPAGNNAIWLRQIAILRHCVGEDVVEILDQFEFDGTANPAENKDRLPDVLAKFEGYFNPRRNLLYEWFVFMSMTQSDGELIDMFVKRLKTQANKCEFETKRDMMILVRCVFGIKCQRLKEKLLQDRNVTLSGAIDMIRASEVTKHQLAEISSDRMVAELKSDVRAPTPAPRKILDCKFCGYDHVRGKCPAYGQECRACGAKNHFRKKCTKKEVSVVSCNSAKMNTNDLFVGMISEWSETSRGWVKTYNVYVGESNKEIQFKVDTGAEANVLPLSCAKELQATISCSDARLRTYSGDLLPNGGKTTLWLDADKVNGLEFELVDGDVMPVLGLKACVGLGIVKRVDSINNQAVLDEFADCFEGIGCLERKHTIKINPEIKPVINRARRIPISRVEKVKEELEKMEVNGIIEKVDQPTEWVNSMVVVEKRDGSVRICLDPKELNKAVMREHHHIPTLEDISFKFSGMSIFTIVDMKSGYWHVPLDRPSQLLTTFNTPFGRYCFTRLPFGINSSAEVFEKRVEEVFGDLDVCIYFDDIIIAGKDQEEHDLKLRRLLQRAREYNVRFNREKIQHNQSEVNYLGHIVSKDGLKPDPEKVKAIEQMPNPENKEGIQRLIGSLNFLRSYIPNVSTVTQPIRELLKADAAWNWGPEQNEAMDRIKQILTSAPVLKYYDVNKDIILQTDASQSGLGAVLLQEGQPVAYASRALTETEQRYPQIDKELLAIVYGCEKFHTYTYGKAIDIQTDHQPLVSIVKKSLWMASPRLQKLLIRLQKYQIKEIGYVPGKLLYLADTLSRAYLPTTEPQIEEDVVMIHCLQLEGSAKAQLYEVYDKDDAMTMLKSAILDGWNWAIKKQAPAAVQPFWNYRDELYIQEDLVYRGARLVIPQSQRRDYLIKLHAGHLGMDKCIERAKQCVFWPGIDRDLRQLISDCSMCLRYANNQQKMPLLPHEVPKLPWNKVGMDILQFQNRDYLVVVDFYSHYPELRMMKGKTAKDVIMALKSIFAVHGIPVKVIADNMPFASETMQQFAKEWSFDIVTSSPHYPQSNGMAERYVQTVKQFLKKAADSGSDIYHSLLAYRQTPVTGLPFSPAEMLFNRCIRGPLPYTEEMLKPVSSDALEYLKARQQTQKEEHDKRARNLEPLEEGEDVLMRTNKESQWSKGTIVAKTTQPRSYVVDTGTTQLRRSRTHLKPVGNADAAASNQVPILVETTASPEGSSTLMSKPGSPASQPHVPMRSVRSNRGTLPQKFDGFEMK